MKVTRRDREYFKVHGLRYLVRSERCAAVASVWFPNVFITPEENSEPFNQQLLTPTRLCSPGQPSTGLLCPSGFHRCARSLQRALQGGTRVCGSAHVAWFLGPSVLRQVSEPHGCCRGGVILHRAGSPCLLVGPPVDGVFPRMAAMGQLLACQVRRP